MAYFANGDEGCRLDAQCDHCKFGEGCCPIYDLQATYNYDQIGNDLAREMLNKLVDQKGYCRLFVGFVNLLGDKEARKWARARAKEATPCQP
jgi:hypothetical protein